MYFFILLIILATLYFVGKLVLRTQVGNTLFFLVPVLLLLINFCVGFEIYFAPVEVPNVVAGDNIITYMLTHVIGGSIDQALGTTFVLPTLNWIIGALFYVPAYAVVHIIVKNTIFCWDDEQMALIGFGIWLLVFTLIYFFNLLDGFIVFKMISMPYNASLNINVYYWLSIPLAFWYLYK